MGRFALKQRELNLQMIWHWWTCWASKRFRGRTSKFVPEMRFEVAGAGKTSRDCTFEMT